MILSAFWPFIAWMESTIHISEMAQADSTFVVFLIVLCRPTPTAQPIAVRRCPKKKKKEKNLEKAPRYPRDIHSKKLPADSAEVINSRLREKWARRLRWRDPVRYFLAVSNFNLL